MKIFNIKTRRAAATLFAILAIIIIAGAAQTARAQVRPFVSCVEREFSGGAATGNYIAYFGYSNASTTNVVFRVDGGNNFYRPAEAATPANYQNAISIFAPGVHPRAVSVVLPLNAPVTWFLGTYTATTAFDPANLCGSDGANSRLMTFQGRLSDGSQTATGVYDLQFQLFNALTDGTARTTQITLEDVPVVNGIFTVQLDPGANLLRSSGGGNTTPDLKLNPAILDGENLFFEIGVRAGNTTGAYTTLTPRQPLTAVPLAMRANTAINAFRADSATTAITATTATSATNATNAINATTAATAGNVTGIVAVANGGTGSTTQNFVDTTTAQTAAGNKTFSGLTNLNGGSILQNSATDPEAASGANAGRVYFNTAIGNLRLSDGARWITAGQPTIYHVYATAGRTSVSTSSLVVQPGLSQTITVPAGFTANVVINASIGTLNSAATANLYSNIDFTIFLDGSILPRGAYNRFTTTNTASGVAALNTSAINTAISLGAGNHTLDVRTSRSGGTVAVNIGGNAVTETNAGELTLTVYYTPITFANRSENGDVPLRVLER